MTPLLIALLSLSVPLWPLGHLIREFDEQLHAGARAETVRRLRAGGLPVFGGYSGQGGRITPN